MKKPEPKVLFYDIETTLLALWGFQLGKTVLRHNQLLKGYYSRTHVICITYRWHHERKSRILTWGDSVDDEKKMIQDFDKLIQEADIVIGKNSNRFDNKHINMQRVWHGLPGMPNWLQYTDDLEVQMRRNFNVPSYSLDYFSEQFGLGGKNSMSFTNWQHINEYRFMQITGCKDSKITEFLFGESARTIKKRGKKALKTMYTYGIKDSDDTVDLWDRLCQHFQPKFNMATWADDRVCKACGSDNIIAEDRERIHGGSRFKYYYCKEHHGYAGRCRILKSGKLGKML